MDGLDRPYSLDLEEFSERAACLTLSGDWDLSNASQIVDAVVQFVERNRTALVIDLRDVSYLDSTALSALLQIQKEAEQSTWTVGIIKPRDRGVWKLFELTALTSRFTFFETRTAALIGLSWGPDRG